MSNIKAIFDKIFIGNTVNDANSSVNVSGNITTSGNLTLGIGSYVSFSASEANTYGIRDSNGTLMYRNSGGVWSVFSTINNGYINFPQNGVYPENNITSQSAGFGIRDNQGVLEFKNRTGTAYTDWTALGTGSGGGGGASVANAGQLYFNNLNIPLSLVGGVEYDIKLDTNMQQIGKIHCNIWEFVSSSEGNIDSTWKIDKGDSNFVMYNYKGDRNVTVQPSGVSGIITLTMNGSVWTADDIGLEYYGNGGSAVIQTYNTSTIVAAVVKKDFINILPESSWQLYVGVLDNDGSFKITSANSLAGIYRIMPDGLVNLSGISIGSNAASSSTGAGRTYDNYSLTWIPPANTSGAFWNAHNDNEIRVQYGHHCVMYNPLIAVNKKINIIGVVSSGMFFKPYLNNGGTQNGLSADKVTMTINISSQIFSYHSQDLLYYIKDGYTVTKREKIFKLTSTAPEIGAPEYSSDKNNYNIISDNAEYSYITHSMSIIAINSYFVLCGIIGINNSTANKYYSLFIASFDSKGERVYVYKMETVTFFYPKLFNGNNNNFWVFTNSILNSNAIIQFMLFNISDSGVITITKTNCLLYTNSSGLNILKKAWTTYTYAPYNHIYITKLIQNSGIPNSSSSDSSNNFICLSTGGVVNRLATIGSVFTIPASTTNNCLSEGISSNQLSKHCYVNLDVITQNNYTYVIFSANTNNDNTYNLYYAFFANYNYPISLPQNYTDISKKLTNTTLDNTSVVDFTGHAQIIPKGIYDKIGRRILIVWLGKSNIDVGTASFRGTYFKFINLTPGTESNDTTTNDNISSLSVAVKLSSNIPGHGGYYNLVQKSNGNIHLLFNAGHNSIYEYVLPVNGSVFYVRLSPTRNIKHAMGYNKILPGQIYDGYVRGTFCGKLSVDIYNDRIVGVGQLINPDLASATNNDFISSYINNTNGRWYQSRLASTFHSVPTTSTYFYEVTSSYDWNIYNRLSDAWISTVNNLGDFSVTDIQQSVFRIYNNVFHVIFTCTTSVVTAKKLFYSYSKNSGQSWSYPIRVTNVSSSQHTLYPENNPDMIIDGSGNMHIVFESTSVDYSNSQIYYVKGTNITTSISFTEIYSSNNVSNNTKGGLSAINLYSQSFPRIVKCGSNNLAVCWQGTNQTYNTTKIFVGTHTDNGNTTVRWSNGNIMSTGDWGNYVQVNPELNYNNRGVLLLTWRGTNPSQLTYTRVYVGVSIDNGLTFTLQTSTTFVNSNISYASSYICHESYLDNSNTIHIMFLINNNIITNTLTTSQSDIFITRASLGNITSTSTSIDVITALENLNNDINKRWTTPYLLTNNRYNITSYQNSTYGTYGSGMQILVDNYNVVYYIYKMRFMNYSTELYKIITNTELNGGTNPAYLTFCTFDGVNYSDIKSIMNEYFYSNISGDGKTSGIYPATASGNYYYNDNKTNVFDFEYSFTIDINRNNNNLYLLCNANYNKYHGPSMTTKTNMYLYEYTQDNKFFGTLDYRPMLNYDKQITTACGFPSTTAAPSCITETTPFTILLKNGKIMSVYSAFSSLVNTNRSANYAIGVVAIYDPNKSNKFIVRSSNTDTLQQYYGSVMEMDADGSTDIIKEKFAGTIQTDEDYWNVFTLSNTPKPSTSSSMIILGVCQDPLYPSNIYILYRQTSSSITGIIGNYDGVINAIYNNLYITFSNNGGESTASANFSFNTEVKVVLETTGIYNKTGDSNNTVLSGSIFAYDNNVYVIYTNGLGKLFLSRLTYTTTGLAFNTSADNTFYVTGTTIEAGTVTTGEGRPNGKYALDYSLDSNNNLLLHILYHGAITTSFSNKVYYYIKVSNLTQPLPTFSTPECVVPTNYQINTSTTTRMIGYGDMVVDRIYNRIYVVYSTNNFTISKDNTFSQKEHNRFVVYTYKNMTDDSTAWSTNTQFDICTGTNSGFAQAIYRNPNNLTTEMYSASDYNPKLYLKNNILHMVTIGSHYNGYISNYFSGSLPIINSISYCKYYSKDISNLNSRFMNNNQPINKSLYFNQVDNITLYPNKLIYVYMTKYPSIVVDNNNTIHVIANTTSLYGPIAAGTYFYRNFHFLTTDDSSYKINTKATAITKSQKSLTTSGWSNIRDFILSDSSNNQSALYSLCYQYTGFDKWYVFNSNLSPRLIMQLNTSTLVYSINTSETYDIETLTLPTTIFTSSSSQDDKTIKVLEEAINNTLNQMTSAQLNQASTFNFQNSTVQSIRFAIILQTNNPFMTPQTSDFLINYTLPGYQLNVTNQYIIKIKSLNAISITPPNDGITRLSYIYITDGSSSGTSSITSIVYTEIVQNNNPISQQLTSLYNKLITNNGSYLTNNNISNTMFQIDTVTNSIKINSIGTYKIDISFDYSISDIVTTYFSIDGLQQESLKSNNVSNVYDRVMISKVQNVTSGVYNFSLYMRTDNETLPTINVQNLKIYIQKIN